MSTPTSAPYAIRTLPAPGLFNEGDTLVVFGEVFERGYVNGLIQEAEAHGLKIIYSTVGRRDESLNLRALTAEEIAAKDQPHIINVPLEAGFDLEPDKNGQRPVDQLKEYGLTGWEDAKLNWKSIEESRLAGVERFRSSVKKYLKELRSHINPNKNIIFAHTMAGGFPRAKVVMPIANKVFKGSGTRYCSSKMFWESEIGRLCDASFNEVTAETFNHLIDLSADLRNEIESNGAEVRYLAYGYHGNETLIHDQYEWFSYSPYLQGFAKVRLEDISKEAFQNGIRSTVFNVPEILTNSSSIFLGVEVALYGLIGALRKEGPQSKETLKVLASCQEKLKEGFSIEDVLQITQDYLTNETIRASHSLKGWPQHNSPEQMQLMRDTSTRLIEIHKDPKQLLTAELSEVVFKACGKIMFHEISSPRQPVAWLGHDVVARVTCSN